jgi:hypothetical protein
MEDANMLNAAEPRRFAGTTDESLSISSESELTVFVLFTSIEWTLKALERACEIARPTGARIVVVVVQSVPFPLPLDTPLVQMEHVITQFEEKVGDLPYDDGIKVSVYLCRNPIAALKRVLNPNCPVVIGMKKRWWPTREQRLATKLRRAGYDVISTRTE